MAHVHGFRVRDFVAPGMTKIKIIHTLAGRGPFIDLARKKRVESASGKPLGPAVEMAMTA
jgi:hypothetical protein